MIKKPALIAFVTALVLTAGAMVQAMGADIFEFDGTVYINDTEVHLKDLEGNDLPSVLINGSVFLPVRALCQALGKEVEWGPGTDVVRIKDISEPDDSQAAFDKDFHLVASVPEKEIFVYGLKPRGLIVYYKDNASFIDAEYKNASYLLPEISTGDITGDGNEEIILSLYTQTQEGAIMEDLHVLTCENSSSYRLTDHVFQKDDYVKEISENVSYTYYPTAETVKMRMSGKDFEAKASKIAGAKVTKLVYGDSVNFTLDGKNIQMTASVYAVTNTDAKGIYLGDIKAAVGFSGERFYLNNLTFIKDNTDEKKMKQTAADLIARDQEIEGIFSGGLQGDSDNIHKVLSSDEFKNGNNYAPAVSDKFTTMEALRSYLEATYSSEERIQGFMERKDDAGQLYFKDVNGKLYANYKIGGKGLALIVDYQSITVEMAEDSSAFIHFNYSLLGNRGMMTVPMSKHDGVWLLDKGIYEVLDEIKS